MPSSPMLVVYAAGGRSTSSVCALPQYTRNWDGQAAEVNAGAGWPSCAWEVSA